MGVGELLEGSDTQGGGEEITHIKKKQTRKVFNNQLNPKSRGGKKKKLGKKKGGSKLKEEGERGTHRLLVIGQERIYSCNRLGVKKKKGTNLTWKKRWGRRGNNTRKEDQEGGRMYKKDGEEVGLKPEL